MEGVGRRPGRPALVSADLGVVQVDDEAEVGLGEQLTACRRTLRPFLVGGRLPLDESAEAGTRGTTQSRTSPELLARLLQRAALGTRPARWPRVDEAAPAPRPFRRKAASQERSPAVPLRGSLGLRRRAEARSEGFRPSGQPSHQCKGPGVSALAPTPDLLATPPARPASPPHLLPFRCIRPRKQVGCLSCAAFCCHLRSLFSL